MVFYKYIYEEIHLELSKKIYLIDDNDIPRQIKSKYRSNLLFKYYNFGINISFVIIHFEEHKILKDVLKLKIIIIINEKKYIKEKHFYIKM